MADEPAWKPDPTARHQYRYWDGGSWTHHVADAGIAAVDSIGPQIPPNPSPPPAAAEPATPEASRVGGWANIENIRAEWPRDSLDPSSDLRGFKQATSLYERDDYDSMMASATLLARTLAHSLYGPGLLRGDELLETVHKTLYCALCTPPDGRTFADSAAKAARLALTIMREHRWQPPSLGGTVPAFEPLMSDTGNYRLLSAAISPPDKPWEGNLRAFFDVAPQPTPVVQRDADTDRLVDGALMLSKGFVAYQAGDRATAVLWFQRAAEAGNSEAYAALTQLADEARDDAGEAHWAKLGAEAGQPFCIGRYGLLLARTANGDLATMRRARDLLERAVELGLLDAALPAVDLNHRLGESARAQRYVALIVQGGDSKGMAILRRKGYL